MDFYDNLHGVIDSLFIFGTNSILVGFNNVWMAHLRVAYDKFGMGSFRNVY